MSTVKVLMESEDNILEAENLPETDEFGWEANASHNVHIRSWILQFSIGFRPAEEDACHGVIRGDLNLLDQRLFKSHRF